jgi:hypothetical protein
MNKKLLQIGLILMFMWKPVFAQDKIITQPLESHPFIEIEEWYAHKGDLSIDEVRKENPSIWKMETLNIPNW